MIKKARMIQNLQIKTKILIRNDAKICIFTKDFKKNAKIDTNIQTNKIKNESGKHQKRTRVVPLRYYLNKSYYINILYKLSLVLNRNYKFKKR